MKPIQAIILGLGVIIIAWASLFITVLNQSSNTNRILKEDTSILKSQKQIIDNLAKNSAQRTAQLNELQNHVDCIVNLFTVPNRANITITDISTCHLKTTPTVSSPPKVAQAPAPTPQSRTTTPTSSPSSSHSSQSPSPPPSSTKKPGIVKQILNFLGV